jgi:hypothetical protein
MATGTGKTLLARSTLYVTGRLAASAANLPRGAGLRAWLASRLTVHYSGGKVHRGEASVPKDYGTKSDGAHRGFEIAMTTPERQLESELIEKLRDLKYEHRPEIRDRASLEKNFREKFQALNR